MVGVSTQHMLTVLKVVPRAVLLVAGVNFLKIATQLLVVPAELIPVRRRLTPGLTSLHLPRSVGTQDPTLLRAVTACTLPPPRSLTLSLTRVRAFVGVGTLVIGKSHLVLLEMAMNYMPDPLL